VGGLASLPAYVAGESDGPYRPETLFWMIPDGPVLGTAVFKPGEAAAHLVEHFHETTRKPMLGPAHVPARVRVDSPELASRLRAGVGATTDVICAPTPEIDVVVASLREHLGSQDRAAPQTHLGPGITPEAMRSFFRATARLFRAAPWKVVPGDAALRVTIESLDVHDAALCVIGQLGEELGFLFFASEDELEAYLAAADGVMHSGKSPQLPPLFALNFERGSEIDTALRKEIARFGWEVAEPKAYPWLVAIDEDMVTRPPTSEELTRFEAIAVALAELVETERGLGDCWRRDRTIVKAISAPTHVGPIEVTLSAPFEASAPSKAANALRDASAKRKTFDIHGEALTRHGELDEEWHGRYCDEVMEAFGGSPEAAVFAGNIGWAHTVMEFGANYFGVTVPRMTSTLLREIVFEIIPRKVTCEPTVASELVDELRAFFAFLKRAHGLRYADACLKVLEGNAVERVKRALSDPRQFGMAKSIMMAGSQAGFDTSTPDGAMAWVREIQGKPLPSSVLLPPLKVPRPRAQSSAEARRANKNRRKTERNARKKNR
jgi:hypothetical protein